MQVLLQIFQSRLWFYRWMKWGPAESHWPQEIFKVLRALCWRESALFIGTGEMNLGPSSVGLWINTVYHRKPNTVCIWGLYQNRDKMKSMTWGDPSSCKFSSHSVEHVAFVAASGLRETAFPTHAPEVSDWRGHTDYCSEETGYNSGRMVFPAVVEGAQCWDGRWSDPWPGSCGIRVLQSVDIAWPIRPSEI